VTAGSWFFYPDLSSYARLFDVGVYNAGFTAIQCQVQQWTSTEFLINEATASAGIQFVAFNANGGGHFAMVSVEFDVTLGGCVTNTVNIYILKMDES
jgi:hypothetical protein